MFVKIRFFGDLLENRFDKLFRNDADLTVLYIKDLQRDYSPRPSVLLLLSPLLATPPIVVKLFCFCPASIILDVQFPSVVYKLLMGKDPTLQVIDWIITTTWSAH